MATVLTILSLVIYFGGILALIIWLVVRTNRIDKENKVFQEDLRHYLEVLHADLNKDND